MQEKIKVYQEAPSNIAIVKYWGKKGIQEPMNPSLSFTLSKSITKTNVVYTPSDHDLTIEFSFEAERKDSFLPKLEKLIFNINHLLPYLKRGHLKIDSYNTFPHSSGIASSASSMAALAKAFVQIGQQLGVKMEDEAALESEIARLGSGSACRSTMKGWVLWGDTSIVEGSSNQFGVDINSTIHENFTDLQDTILVIRKGVKSVSSTVGHSLMKNHPYQEGRIVQANLNISRLMEALKSGNFKAFSEVCEEEALSLHALMMSSSPSYTLMAPESLIAIEKIKAYKKSSGLPLTFTLDAGPNIHLIYPKKHSTDIVDFATQQLQPLCEDNKVIYDEISMPLN